MFEERTFEQLKAEYLAAAPAGVDTRQGSIYYDTGAGILLVVARQYADLERISELTAISTATGEYLDEKGRECAVERKQAEAAIYTLMFSGSGLANGQRFFAGGQYFRLITYEGKFCLEAESAGIAGNNITPGTAAVPFDNLPALESAAIGELIIPGTDIESDDDYRSRIQNKKAGPAQNGNQAHYKFWAESQEGVGRARVIPLWNGANTVKVVLLGEDGTPAKPALVNEVQTYIDPGSRGLGEGVASIGAYCSVVAANSIAINVSFGVELRDGYSLSQAQSVATEALQAYLKDLMLNSADDESVTVRLSALSSIIYSLPPVRDFSDLKINNATANIEIGNECAAILGEVAIVESVQ